jgi:hypothetical protein
MAIKDLQKSFKESLTAASEKYKVYIAGLGAGTLAEFHFHVDALVEACEKGTKLVAEGLILIADDKDVGKEESDAMLLANDPKVWKKLITARFKEIIKSRKWGGANIKATGGKKKHPDHGVYFLQTQKALGSVMASGGAGFSLAIWCRKPSDADKIIKRGIDKLLKDLWEDFQKHSFGAASGSGQEPLRLWGRNVPADDPSTSRKAAKDKKPPSMTTMKKFRRGIDTEHAEQGTIAKFALEQNYEDIKIGGSIKYGIKYLDPVKYIKDNMKADWSQVAKKKQFANFEVNNVVTLRLGLNPELDTDTRKLGDYIYPYLKAEILAANVDSPLSSIALEASTPVANLIRDDVIKDITKDYRLAANRPRTKSGAFDMRFRVNRGLKNLKSFKPINRKERLGGTGSGTSGITKRTKKVFIKGKKRKQRKESGQGQEARTSIATDLARLKKEINKNLSSEVRRNMGKPALSYRTGRFANSVQLLNLMEARNTVIAKYTYLLSPYQTFENQGKYRWPMSYNPKTLIAKSIRNLAQGRIEQKLTVRRV